MTDLIEQYIIEFCSPTLASLKTGSMFSIDVKDIHETILNIRSENIKLNPKGVYVELLRYHKSRALIYVYRKSDLESDLQNSSAQNILRFYGYDDINLRGYIDFLKKRLAESSGFPHEIGLFLGYPPEDVKGFILNSGQNFKCSGCWKVYCDEKKSRMCFERFKKCKAVYKQLFEEGRPIIKLTVSN